MKLCLGEAIMRGWCGCWVIMKGTNAHLEDFFSLMGHKNAIITVRYYQDKITSGFII